MATIIIEDGRRQAKEFGRKKIPGILSVALLAGLVVFSACNSQRKLMAKKISAGNYQEIIGEMTNPIDTLPDKYPMYPEGLEGLQKDILTNMKYPQNALSKRVQGRVIVGFVVEKNGKINDIWIEQSVDPELDAEAIRVVRTFKIWIPGYAKRKPVRIKYLLPFSFRL